VAGLGELLQRMQHARSSAASYSAEARLTYLGPEGRIKGTAVLLVQRPERLRCDIMGPHGGVVQAFATTGSEMQVLDLSLSRFLYGPATAANIDAMLPLAPLGLEPRGWVALLFGEVQAPERASLAYDDRIGRFVISWSAGRASTHRIEVDPHTSRVVRAVVLDGAELRSEALIERGDETCVPGAMRLRAPAAGVDLSVRLRDVSCDARIDPTVFTLDPPDGATTVRLDS
jgi:hypothetical protein